MKHTQSTCQSENRPELPELADPMRYHSDTIAHTVEQLDTNENSFGAKEQLLPDVDLEGFEFLRGLLKIKRIRLRGKKIVYVTYITLLIALGFFFIWSFL